MNLRLRPATADDSELLLAWRNDPVTRASAFSSAPISAEEHADWLARKLSDPRSLILIAELGGRPVGQVRLDAVSDEVAEMDVGVAPDDRGRGIGGAALVAAAREAPARLGVRRLRALVKLENEASLRAFRAAGFEPTSPAIGGEAIELVLELPAS